MTTATFAPPEVWMRLKNRQLLLNMMDRRGVSTRRLSLAVGYKSHAYLARLLRGEINTLPTGRALLIAHYFQVGVDDLFVLEGSSDGGDFAKRERSAA